jgi:hypothetical protein
MSWQIPTQIEQDIIAGKAKYKTFQTGNGGQSILPVPPNSYAVIFGYDFSPAGGGFKALYEQNSSATAINVLNDTSVRWFETQQISFYTGNDFFPFIHHCDIKSTLAPLVIQNNTPPSANIVASYQIVEEVDNTPIARQVYITSSNDVTITVGLILSYLQQLNTIPVTPRTPNALSYGGSGQFISTRTDNGPVLTPTNFIQPALNNYDDFGLPALPGNPDNQLYAVPDATRGLLDPSVHLNNLGIQLRDAAACNYALCIHYAVYTQTIPEQRG